MKKIVQRRITINDEVQASELHPLLKLIYSARGIKSPEEVNYSLSQLLPFAQLKNIETALDLLQESLKKQERILIIGDFDADGATSTAVAMLALKAFGFNNVSYLIPNRFEFGYGLTKEIVIFAASLNPDLIITVDNGIASGDGVLEANNRGIKVIITDHHLPPQELPNAAAIINPNQEGDEFPGKNLAGVGVIFYCLLALRHRLRQIGWFKDTGIAEPNMAQFLDLVALGTVADLVPLDKNNRILVHHGLQRIKSGQCRIGIKALLSVAKRDWEQIKTNDLGFAVAPRLNAAGRLDDMSLGVECLVTDDINKATEIAKTLNELNDTRREIEAGMQTQAIEALASLQLDKNLPRGLCIFDPTWHAGVVGLLASRIKDLHHRPVIAFARTNEGEIKGSGRSVSGFHLRDALSNIAVKHPSLISKFGGHAMAAGLSLAESNYEIFSQLFNLEVEKYLGATDLKAELCIDSELKGAELSLSTARLLQEAGPWGQDFPEPMFGGTFTVLQQRLLGEKHLKMLLASSTERSQALNAIRFNVDRKRWPNARCKKVYLVYRLDINEYNDQSQVQLIVEHMQEV